MTDLPYPPLIGCESKIADDDIHQDESMDDMEDVKACNTRNVVLNEKMRTAMDCKIPVQNSFKGWNKTKRCSKQNQNLGFSLETSNQFEPLKMKIDSDLEFDIDTCKTERGAKLPTDILKTLDMKSTTVEVKKEIKYKTSKIIDNSCLKQFETRNIYDVFIDNAEECIEKIMKRNQLLSVPRQYLKKCRKCGFKKRNCLIDPLTCTSYQSCCYKCGKIGHFPKSLMCKARNTHKKKKKIEYEHQSPKKISMSKEICCCWKNESMKLNI